MAAVTKGAAPTTYNTGFFSSPADLLQAAKLANQTVTAIDGAVTAATNSGQGSVPDNWSTSWLSFKATWAGFYAANFVGQNITEEWFTSDLEGQLLTFQGKIATYGQQAQGYGLTIPGGVPQVQNNSLPDWFPSFGNIAAVGLIVLATIVAWKVL